MRVLTFNLHSQYLYLLSHTGWDIENHVISPDSRGGWHTQPYGYPTHPGAVNYIQGLPYGYLHPKNMNTPPPIPMAPAVTNIKNVKEPTGEYDLLIFIERNSLIWNYPNARRRVFVNLSNDGYRPNGLADETITHAPKANNALYVPMGMPDRYLPWVGDKESLLFSFGSVRTRPQYVNMNLIKTIRTVCKVEIADMMVKAFSYTALIEKLRHPAGYVSAAKIPGGPVMATIEALLAGIPTLIYDPYQHFEGFEHEKGVFFVENEDALPYASRLMTDKAFRAETSAAGRAAALKVFSIDRFVEAWKAVASG